MFLILNILHSWRRESSLKPNVSLTWFSQPWLAQKDQSPVALKSTTISFILPVNLQVIQPTYLNQGVHNAPILSLFPLTDALHKCRVLGELLEAAGLESCIRTVLSGGCQGFDSPVGHQWASLPLDFCGAFSIIGTCQLCFWQLFVQLSTLNQRRSPSVSEITPMEHRLPPPAGIESFLFSGRHKNVQGSRPSARVFTVSWDTSDMRRCKRRLVARYFCDFSLMCVGSFSPQCQANIQWPTSQMI